MKSRPRWLKPLLITAMLCLCAWGTLWSWKWLILSGPWVNSLAFSPDGKTLAGAGGWKIRQSSTALLGIVWLWDAQTGARRARLVMGSELLGRAAFTRDGSTVAAVLSDGTHFFWNAADGRLIKTDIPRDTDSSLSLSEPRSLFYPGSFPCRVVSSGCLIETEGQTSFEEVQQKAVRQLDWMSGKQMLLAIQDSGRLMAVTQWFERGEKTGVDLTLRDTATGSLQTKYPFSSGKVYVTRFSPNGERLLIAQLDRESGIQLVLWHYKTQKILRLRGYEGRHPATAAFSPDGKRVAVGGLYGEVQLWDTQSGKSLASWQGS